VLDVLSLRADGFSCTVDVFRGGLGIQIAIFDFKKFDFISAVQFNIFGHQNPGSESGSGLRSVMD
jgi:hypothetical protein